MNKDWKDNKSPPAFAAYVILYIVERYNLPLFEAIPRQRNNAIV